MPNFNSSGSAFSDEREIHVSEHAQPDDNVWHDDEYTSRSNTQHASALPGSGRTTQQPQVAGEVIYTEKVTKEYDAQGNVIATKVEHPKPGSLNALIDDDSGRHGSASATAAPSGIGSRGRQPVVSQSYGRPGRSHIGNEIQRINAAQERGFSGNGTKQSTGDEFASQGPKAMGKATPNSN